MKKIIQGALIAAAVAVSAPAFAQHRDWNQAPAADQRQGGDYRQRDQRQGGDYRQGDQRQGGDYGRAGDYGRGRDYGRDRSGGWGYHHRHACTWRHHHRVCWR